MTELTAVANPYEVEKSVLFSRISTEDSKNLHKLNDEIQTIAKEKGLTVTLLVVGGVLEKSLPRKDIDLISIFEVNNFPKRGDYKENYEYAVATFNLLEEIVGKAVALNQNMKIIETIQPSIDEEYGSPAILKHDGTIKIGVSGGTTIEFIGGARIGFEKEIEQEKRPYVVLSK